MNFDRIINAATAISGANNNPAVFAAWLLIQTDAPPAPSSAFTDKDGKEWGVGEWAEYQRRECEKFVTPIVFG